MSSVYRRCSRVEGFIKGKDYHVQYAKCLRREDSVRGVLDDLVNAVVEGNESVERPVLVVSDSEDSESDSVSENEVVVYKDNVEVIVISDCFFVYFVLCYNE